MFLISLLVSPLPMVTFDYIIDVYVIDQINEEK